MIWAPQVDVKKLQMLKQTMISALGLARVGNKYGLRCRIEHAKQVHQAIRPGLVFLPPGRKQLWLVGPFPFRASITEALEGAGWTARPARNASRKRQGPDR